MIKIGAQYNLGFNSTLSKYRGEYLKYVIEKYDIKSILDIGSGLGEIFDYLIAAYPGFIENKLNKIILVEPFDEYASVLIKKFGKDKKFSIYQNMIENLEFNETYDLVMAIDLLEHVDDPIKVIKNMGKILNNNGIFMGIVPNASSLHRQVGLNMGIMNTLYDLGEHDLEVGHKRYYDIQSLNKDFIESDFYLLESSGIVLKPLTNFEMNKLPIQYIDALYNLGHKYPELCGEIVGLFKRNNAGIKSKC